ncbi:Linear gramicidin synthase subunit D [Peptoniphilus harei]|uniref:Linear gramicidin synthase subunit D n=1 Tax=Peptoniphilus harei TaxID=54005 RepID=A0A2X1XJU8_9FIRM|nr:hypothetical protein [Peptoniphilus harei]SPY43647.1 Linear gramicidin synthase subunit D [Peptoniphilus harei]
MFFKNNKIDVEQDELIKFLKNKLPEYMIPFEFVIVGEMPLNKNGKIDRKELRKLIEDMIIKILVMIAKVLKVIIFRKMINFLIVNFL